MPSTPVEWAIVAFCLLGLYLIARDMWRYDRRMRRAVRNAEARHARRAEDYYWATYRNADKIEALRLRAIRLGAATVADEVIQAVTDRLGFDRLLDEVA